MIQSPTRVIALIAAVLMPALAAGAPKTVAWSAEITERIPAARVEADGSLRVATPGPADLSLIEIESPAIGEPFFGFRTRIRHQRVTAPGWIHMDVDFGAGEVYFSRQPLEGDASWRPLVLPFNASAPNGARRTPTALRLRLILPGGGDVSLGSLEIVESGSWAEISRPPGAWWSASEAAWIGALGGAALGALGALAGILVGRGRARGLAMTICWLAAALGLVALLAGLIALARNQGYAVYYPLLLIGALGVVIFPLFALRARGAYASGELRRMRARDA